MVRCELGEAKELRQSGMRLNLADRSCGFVPSVVRQ
jgi:hypothetical protein